MTGGCYKISYPLSYFSLNISKYTVWTWKIEGLAFISNLNTVGAQIPNVFGIRMVDGVLFLNGPKQDGGHTISLDRF